MILDILCVALSCAIPAAVSGRVHATPGFPLTMVIGVTFRVRDK